MTKRLADLSPEQREVVREKARAYREATKERRRVYDREYIKRRRSVDPQYRARRDAVSRRSRIKSKYGITEAHVKQTIANQKNKCAICERRLKGYHIDHCHKTGKFRAILCPGCNTFLGKIEKHPRRLWAALHYLERHK
jgi:hypothetical protein